MCKNLSYKIETEKGFSFHCQLQSIECVLTSHFKGTYFQQKLKT